jgi:hypothetical protein
MSYSEQRLVTTLLIVAVLSLVVSGIVRLLHRTSRKALPTGTTVLPPVPGGTVLGMFESFFYFAVLSTEGAGFLAGAWLAFKLATRWQSAHWSKPTEQETRAGYRAFQVGTIGTLLVGVVGAALLRQ